MAQKNFQCTRCKKSFVYKTGLTAHIKRIHPLQPVSKKNNKTTTSEKSSPINPRIVQDLINIDTQDLEDILKDEQEFYDAAEEIEHNIGVNQSMVDWYDVNFSSSFSNTGEFANRISTVLPQRDCEDYKLNSQTFEKQRELLMKQDKKIVDFQTKHKVSSEEVKQLKKKLQDSENIVKDLQTKLKKNDDVVEFSIKCIECDFAGKSMEELKEHKNTACSEALIRRLTEEEGPLNIKDSNCEKCSFQNTNRVLLDEHREKAHKGPIKCVTCGNISLNMESFREHGKKHMEEIKKRSSHYPGKANNFKCSPCKVFYKTNDELMNHLSEVHITEAQRLETGLQKYYENIPECRNGDQCRYHRQNRCNFLHNTPPPKQQQQVHQLRQAPSNQWHTVPSKQQNYNRNQIVQKSREEKAQGHRYWGTPPLWRESGDQRPWCQHGNMCPMGNYCVLRHLDDQNFINWQQQGQQ